MTTAGHSKTPSSRRSFLAISVLTATALPLLAGCSNDLFGQAVGAALNSGIVQAPTFAVQSFAVQSLSLESQVLQINTLVSNPNPMQVTINSVDLSVMLAGIDLGRTTAQQSFTVPANGSTVVPLTLNANLIAVLNQSVGLLNVRLDTPLPYALTGSVNVSQLGIPVPVNIQGTVTPNQVIGMAQLLSQVTGGLGGGALGGSGGGTSSLLGGVINAML